MTPEIQSLVERLRNDCIYDCKNYDPPCLHCQAAAALAQLAGERDEAQQLVSDILEERADELTKEACDNCEQCGDMVMCSFHSVLSELARRTWTTPALERDELKRTQAALTEARAQLASAEQRSLQSEICLACGGDLYPTCVRCHQKHAKKI